MSIRDGDRLPRRRILTGSDLMIVGDRMPGKRYNGFIKSLFVWEIKQIFRYSQRYQVSKIIVLDVLFYRSYN